MSNLSAEELLAYREKEATPSMIKAENITMVFNMASEKLTNLKEYAIKLLKHELFFEELIALDNVSVDVKKGDVFGIIGTNGSGKSTLLKIIAGVLTPTKGTVEINGNIAPLIELGAGFDMDLSARENIYLNGALLGYSKKFIDQHFDSIVEFAEIEKFLDMPLKNYSSGMVARIAFSIATVMVPEILIVDEVLSVGDFMFQKKCEDRIMDLIENHGVTVLIVSHSNDQIARLCNKAIWIEKGKMVMEGNAQHVVRVYNGLGGRSGSQEAYQHVYHALVENDPKKEGLDSSFLVTERAHDRYSLELVQTAWKDEKTDVVVLAGDKTHANALIGSPLAGAYGAPLVLSKPDGLSNSLLSFLEGKRPGKIFIIDIDDSMQSVEEEVKSLEWRPETIRFNGGLFETSSDVYEYGLKRSLWGKSAALVSFNDSMATLAASTQTHSCSYPVFFSSAEVKENELLLSRLANDGLDEVLLLDSNPQSFPDNTYGLKIKRFTGKTQDELSRSLLDAVLSPESPIDLFITASTSHWPFLVSAGCVGSKTKKEILLVNEEDLESISRTLDFIDTHKSGIRALYTLGSDLSSSGFPPSVYIDAVSA